MDLYAPRVHTHARLVAGLVLAGALSFGLVGQAGAQPLRPSDLSQPKGRPRGITLEQALDAVRDAAQPGGPAASAGAAAQVEAPVSAVFIPQSGILAVIGNDSDNNLVVSRDAAGALLVNNGAIAVRGPKPTVANTALVQVFGRAGNDSVRMDQTNGALPAADLFGGAGNDVIVGGAG